MDDSIKMFSSVAKFLWKMEFWNITCLQNLCFALLCLWMAGPFRCGFAQMEHAWKLTSLELAAKEWVNLFKNCSDFQVYLDRSNIWSKNALPPWITFCFPFLVVPSSPYVYQLPPVSPGYPPAQSYVSCQFQLGRLEVLNFQPGSCTAVAYSFFQASTTAAVQCYSKKTTARTGSSLATLGCRGCFWRGGEAVGMVIASVTPAKSSLEHEPEPDPLV